MVRNLTRAVPRGTGADPTPPWISAIGLTIAVGITYFIAGQLSLAVLAKSDGLAFFWLAGGVSAGVLIALGRDAQLPVTAGVMVATVIASLMNDRNIWVSAGFALCNVGEAMLASWLIERYVGWPFSLDRLRNVLGLLTAGVAATAASGLGATVAYRLFHSPTVPICTTWYHWFASGTVGIRQPSPLLGH